MTYKVAVEGFWDNWCDEPASYKEESKIQKWRIVGKKCQDKAHIPWLFKHSFLQLPVSLCEELKGQVHRLCSLEVISVLVLMELEAPKINQPCELSSLVMCPLSPDSTLQKMNIWCRDRTLLKGFKVPSGKDCVFNASLVVRTTWILWLYFCLILAVLSAFPINLHVLWTSACCTLRGKLSLCSQWDLLINMDIFLSLSCFLCFFHSWGH